MPRFRASASSSRTSSMWGPWPPCSASMIEELRNPAGRAVQAGKEQADQGPNVEALHHGPRLGEGPEPCLPDRAFRFARADNVGDRIFVEGNAAAGTWRGLRRGDRLRLVSDHPLHLPGRGLHAPIAPDLRTDPETGQGPNTPSSRPRTRLVLDRRGDRRRLERRTGLHGHLRPRRLPDAPSSSASAYFAEIPAVIFDVQRGGPVHRHADPHPAVPT